MIMLMKTKITSITLLIAVVAMIFVSAIAYGNLASAKTDKDGSNYEADNNHKFLSNCLANDRSDGQTEFGALNCSPDNGNTQVLRTETADSPDDADVSMINYNIDVENNDHSTHPYDDDYDDPYEVGWD